MLWTPQGYYDASPGAEDLIGWQVNHGLDEAPELYAASRFRDRFHRPDVIDRVLQELDVDAAVAKADAAKPAPARAAAAPVTVLDILPPTVAIIEPQEGAPAPAGELTVTYIVSAPERDPPTRVKLLVDGDLAAEATLPPSASGQRERRLIAELPAGGSLLTLMARNGQGWGDPVTVRLRRPAPAIVHALTGSLYVLAVGINQYRNHGHLALSYAVADAEDFCSALLPQQGCMYKEVQVRPLTDGEATQRVVLP